MMSDTVNYADAVKRCEELHDDNRQDLKLLSLEIARLKDGLSAAVREHKFDNEAWGRDQERLRQSEADCTKAVRERDEALERGNRMQSACQKLAAALSKIDYLCGEPNDMELSGYDIHCNEDEVIKTVVTLRKERDEARAECERLREDAERYRWLRNHINYSVRLITDDENGLAVRYRRWYHDSNELHVFTIDEAVDAARRAG